MNPARLRKLSIAKFGLAVAALSVAGASAFLAVSVAAADRGIAQDSAGSPAPSGGDVPPPPPPTLDGESPPATAPSDLSTLTPPPPDSLKEAGKSEDEAAKADAEKPVDEPASAEGALGDSTPIESTPEPSRMNSDDYDPRVPPHYYYRPQFGVSFMGTARAFASIGGGTVRGFSLLFEYQPRFVQKIGVLSIGPTVAVYPIYVSNSLSGSAASIWSVGGIVRYQARWFRNQWLVPTVGFAFDRISYNASAGSGNAGSTTQSGPVFGLMLLLNAIDPDTAAASFVEPGIVRSYLFAELKKPTGGDAVIVPANPVYQFGLRIEF